MSYNVLANLTFTFVNFHFWSSYSILGLEAMKSKCLVFEHTPKNKYTGVFTNKAAVIDIQIN